MAGVVVSIVGCPECGASAEGVRTEFLRHSEGCSKAEVRTYEIIRYEPAP